MIAVYRGRREARVITSPLVNEGMWSGKALSRQSYGKGKRVGVGKRQEVCYRQKETLFLKDPGWIGT